MLLATTELSFKLVVPSAEIDQAPVILRAYIDVPLPTSIVPVAIVAALTLVRSFKLTVPPIPPPVAEMVIEPAESVSVMLDPAFSFPLTSDVPEPINKSPLEKLFADTSASELTLISLESFTAVILPSAGLLLIVKEFPCAFFVNEMLSPSRKYKETVLRTPSASKPAVALNVKVLESSL